jgi:hypothetical protein
VSEEGRFPQIYQQFLQRRGQGQGFNFEEVPIVSEVPPAVRFPEKLRWWSLDRWKRMKRIRQERDRRLQEILRLKHHADG